VGLALFPCALLPWMFPWVVITSLLVGVLLFLFFTVALRIPDLVSAFFTAVIVLVYLAALRRELRR
jgi:hypothetical protein